MEHANAQNCKKYKYKTNIRVFKLFAKTDLIIFLNYLP